MVYFWWPKQLGAVINLSGQQQRQNMSPSTTLLCALQVDGLQLSSGSRGVNNGLWGVWLKNGADNLIRNFNAGSRLVRDIAVQGLQPGTVISNSECTAAHRLLSEELFTA